MKFRLALAVATAASAMSLPAVAQTPTAMTSFQVTATVVATCNVSAGNMAFGNYNSSAGNTSTSSITVTWLAPTPYTMVWTPVRPARSALPPRSARWRTLLATSWRTACTSTAATPLCNVASGIANLNAATVYGMVPASQTAPPGSYSATWD